MVEPIHIHNDDLTVTKTITENDTGEVQIQLQLESTRRQAVPVRVIDPLPASAYGQSPVFETDKERWRSTETAVEYRITLPATETVSTAYRLPSTDQALATSCRLPPVLVLDDADLNTTHVPLLRGASASEPGSDTGLPLSALSQDAIGVNASDAGPLDSPLSQPPTAAQCEQLVAFAAEEFEEPTDLYHLVIEFSSKATPADRIDLYSLLDRSFELVASTPSKAILDARTIAKRLDVVLATADELSTATDSVAGLECVETITTTSLADRNLDVEGSRDETLPLKRDRESPHNRFKSLQEETQPLDPNELVTDPAYLEFLEDVDHFEGPDDELSLDEVIAYTGSDTVHPARADGNGRSSTDAETGDEPSHNDGPMSLSEKWTQDGETNTTAHPESVLEALLSELDGMSNEQRARVQTTLLDSSPSRGSLDARVSYLQHQYGELAAYIDALEEFLDEHGTAQTLLDELAAEIHQITTDLEDVHHTQRRSVARLDALVESQDDAIARVESSQGEAMARLTALEEALQELEGRQDDLAADVEELLAFKQRLLDVV